MAARAYRADFAPAAFAYAVRRSRASDAEGLVSVCMSAAEPLHTVVWALPSFPMYARAP